MGVMVVMLVTLAVIVIGGGIGYFLFMKSQPKKIAWTAHCYQLGEGIRQSGSKESPLKLKDLRPYTKDILVRIEKQYAQTVHKLERLNMTTNAVNADMVDVWGPQDKVVHVLIQGDTATVLKKGYDYERGEEIFQPMSRARMDLIKSEILIKKDKLKREKSILEAITPWIVTGICILGLVSVAYFLSNSFLDSSEVLAQSEKYAADKQEQTAGMYRDAISSLTQQVNRAEAVINTPVVEPPSIPYVESPLPVPAGNDSLGRQ